MCRSLSVIEVERNLSVAFNDLVSLASLYYNYKQ